MKNNNIVTSEFISKYLGGQDLKEGLFFLVSKRNTRLSAGLQHNSASRAHYHRHQNYGGGGESGGGDGGGGGGGGGDGGGGGGGDGG